MIMAWIGETSYDIGKPGERCAATGELLKPGQEYVAVLLWPPAGTETGRDADAAADGDEEKLQRLDFSRAAWEAGRGPSAESIFAFWRGVVPEPGRKKQSLIDDDSLLAIFEQLEGAEEPRRVAFRFVLALSLIRKRLLKLVGSRDGAMIVRMKGAPDDAPPMEVIDPGLSAEMIRDVTEQISALIVGDG